MKRNPLFSGLMLCLLLWNCEEDRIDLPQVIAYPGEIELTPTLPTAQFFLTTDLPFQIGWQITDQPDWLLIEPLQGDIIQTPLITITANVASMLPGNYSEFININTTTGSLQVRVSIVIINSTAVQITPEALFFDYQENSKSLSLQNNSDEIINWRLVPSVQYLTISPSLGILQPGQSSNVTVTVNRGSLSPQLYTAKLALMINDQSGNGVAVSVNNYAEGNLLLSGVSVDAEYDRVHDKLIAITTSALLKVDLKERTLESVTLEHTANCLSVSTDGESAIVGHHSAMTLVDLSSMQVEENYEVTTDVLDIILAPNNWVYAFPRTDQWQYIRCINLADGSEVNHTGFMIYAGTKAKLHPSGKYIYGANNGVVPSDAEKYDIQEGRANYLYHSPYHGDHEFYGQIWLADDGLKLLSRGNNIFNLSETKATDLIYTGTLPVANKWVHAADFCTSKNRIGVVFYDYDIFNGIEPQNSVNFFDATDYTYVEEKLFLNLIVQTGTGLESVPALGQSGFFDSTGTTFYAIVNSGSKGLIQQWAVATIHL